jgi:Flp pilus assembly protein TadG
VHLPRAEPTMQERRPGLAGWRRDSGGVSIFLAVTFAGLALLAGLIVDAGRVLHANAHASDLAGKAARVGAQEIDLTSLRAGRPRLDHAAAEAAAGAYLVDHDLRGDVAATDTAVVVTVTWHVDFHLAAFLRPDGATVIQTRVAAPTAGP